MNLKNYTSGIAADRSISRIEAMLVALGATNINKQYVDAKLSAISFMILVNGNTLPFKLPAKIAVVEKVLLASYKRPTPATIKNIAEQAQRTAWKILSDWVEIQQSMIQLQQAEFLEVFLPYVYHIESDKTYFERLKETNYKALLK